ncbi:hypothetical protein HY382_01880 [Candidatus Curtissbacteria bacterium]|nr:hypothetical protein [Candidatus Curtissbacteria bacterium]
MSLKIETEIPSQDTPLVASFLPEPQVVTNQDLVEFIAKNNKNSPSLSAEDIRRKTGIIIRHYRQPLGQESDSRLETIPCMAEKMAKALLLQKGWKPEAVDLFAVITTYPLGKENNISGVVSGRLNISHAETVDVYAGCVGPVYFLDKLRRIGYGDKDKILAVSVEHYTPSLDPGLDMAVFSDQKSGIAFEGKDLTLEDSEIIMKPSRLITFPINKEDYPEDSWAMDMPTGSNNFSMKGFEVYEAIRNGPLFGLIKYLTMKNPESEALVPHPGSGKVLDMIQRQLQKIGLSLYVSRETLAQFGNGAAASNFAELGAFLKSPKGRTARNIILAAAGAGMAFGAVRVVIKKR